MDPLELVIVGGLVLPLYGILWDINRKIGKYDQVCVDFYQLRKAHHLIQGSKGDKP